VPVRQPNTTELGAWRKQAAPQPHAVEALSYAVFAGRALSKQTQATRRTRGRASHAVTCCVEGHTRLAYRMGADAEEIMEAIWAAAAFSGKLRWV
jgi:AhpD family alkylhydroperoxidase